MDNIDDPWNFHQCKLCRYKTRFLHCILSHVRQHRTRSKNHRFVCDVHSPENYQCEKCHFQTDLKVLLTEHVNTVHKTEETQHYPTPDLRYCEKCDFQTYSSLLLLSHNNRCDGSGSPAKGKDSLVLGKGKKHSKRRRGRPPLYTNGTTDGFLQCNYCSYKGRYKGNLSSHILHNHTPSDQINWFKCEFCSYKGKVKQAFERHMLTKKHIMISTQNKTLIKKDHSKRKRDRRDELHTNRKKNRVFQCSHCSYKTKQNGNLNKHMLWKHTPSDQINWFTCEYCPYKTKAKQALHEHMITRSHVQPTELKKLKYLKCDQCAYITTILCNLRSHVLRKHTPLDQINWVKCDFCSYKSRHKYQLRQHVLVKHTEPAELEKPEKFKVINVLIKLNKREII